MHLKDFKILFLIWIFCLGSRFTIIAQANYFSFSQSCDFIHLHASGQLFLSSTEGLYYHNGTEVKKVDLQELGEANIQSGFFPDHSNNLWFCTYNRIVKLHLTDFCYEYFPLINENGDTLNSDYYIFHLADSIILAKSGNTLYSFNIHTLKSESFQRGVDGRRLFPLNNKGIPIFLSYYYTSAPQIVQFSPEFDNIRSINPWKDWPLNTYATDVITINSDMVLFTSTNGLYYGELSSSTIKPVPISRLKNINIRSIGYYEHNTAILSSKTAGTFLLDLHNPLKEQNIKLFNIEGIPTFANKILSQPDGTVFLSVYDKGIYYFHPDRIKFNNLHYRNQDCKEFFYSLFDKRENLDLRTSSTFDTALVTASNNNIEIYSKTPFKESYIKLANSKQKLCKHPVDTTLYGFFKDGKDEIYAGFVNGEIYHVSEQSWHKVQTPEFNLLGINYYFPVTDSLHLASLNHEKMVLWKTGSRKPLKMIPFAGNLHNAIFINSFNLLALSTTAGLGLLNIKSLKWQVYNPENSCYCVLQDDKGSLWYSTPSQIVKFDPITHKSKIFNSTAGASIYKYQPGNCKKLSSDSLLFFHDEGVTIIAPSDTTIYQKESDVYISSFSINNQPYKLSELLNYEDEFITSYSNNTLSFLLTNIDWSDDSAHSLKYKMEGIDKDWNYIHKSEQEVRYPSMPAGKYTFKVIGQNADGVWNKEAKQIDIVIRPPYWQTWWFRTLMLLTAGGILYWVVRANYEQRLERKNLLLREQSLIIEKQQAIESERTRIASEMHDDLGSGLTTIRYLSDKALTHASTSEEAKQIKRIADHSNTLVRNMSEIIWAMNSRFDNTDDLTGYLRRYASEYLDERNMKFTFTSGETDVPLNIGGEKRRNIFLVFKELLHNSVKYAKADSIAIQVNISEHFLIKISEIGGKGFDPDSSIEKGNGLFNCRKRLKSIEGELTFSKTPDAMNIIISVPINTPSVAEN